MRIDILDVPIDNLPKKEILDQIKNFLSGSKQNLITTPNPEMLVDSERDWFFKEIFRRSSLNIADGFGLVLASWFLYGQKLFRYPGTDLMLDICKMAQEENKTVFLLGANQEVIESTAKKLLELFPKIKIVGTNPGLKIKVICNDDETRVWHNEFLTGLNFNQEDNQKIIDQINQVKPDILFVAFGHIKQEKWLMSYLSQLPSIKVAVGVGGAFDYISGTVNRAPQWVRTLGLEWFWRLFSNPIYRTQRVFKATFTFLNLVWGYKILLKRPLRRGVVGFVVNRSGEFFLAKRTPEPYDCYSLYTEQWQPPQGGAEPGESLEDAVTRETKEETGMDVTVICSSKTPHKYNWSTESARRLRFKKYRGTEKYIFLLQYNGDGSDIKLEKAELCEYKWINLEELKHTIHPLRRHSLEILLKDCLNKLPAEGK